MTALLSHSVFSHVFAVAPRDSLVAACHAGSMLEVMEWLRCSDDSVSIGMVEANGELPPV